AEPGDPITPPDPDQTENQNDRQGNGDRLIRYRRQNAEVKYDHHGNEEPQDQEEFPLSDQIGLAGLINQFGDFAHGAMDRHVPQAGVDDEPEAQAKDAKQNSDHQQAVTVYSKEEYLREVRKLQTGFSTHFIGR